MSSCVKFPNFPPEILKLHTLKIRLKEFAILKYYNKVINIKSDFNNNIQYSCVLIKNSLTLLY